MSNKIKKFIELDKLSERVKKGTACRTLTDRHANKVKETGVNAD